MFCPPSWWCWVAFWSFCNLLIICPNCACVQLFLVSYSFFVFCLSRCKHCSKGSQVQACLKTKKSENEQTNHDEEKRPKMQQSISHYHLPDPQQHWRDKQLSERPHQQQSECQNLPRPAGSAWERPRIQASAVHTYFSYCIFHLLATVPTNLRLA